MRKVAAFAVTQASGSASEASIVFKVVQEKIDAWLAEKGSETEGGQFNFRNGPPGRISRSGLDVPTLDGEQVRLRLEEQTGSGMFVSDVTLGRVASNLALFIELRAAVAGDKIKPFQFDVRRPKLLADVIGSSPDWFFGQTPLVADPYFFSGKDDRRAFLELLWHPDRSVPVVAVSTVQGRTITENFAANLASDLCGLAIVCVIDEEISWGLSHERGVRWSCYNGAVRLYWPIEDGSNDPLRHPLWTREALFSGVVDPRDASYRIRSQLRRQLLGVSAFSVREPDLFRHLRVEAAEVKNRELKAAFARSAGDDGYQAIAESYAKANDELLDQVREKDLRIEELEDVIDNLKLSLRFTSAEKADVAPVVLDAISDPETVADALRVAMDRFSDRLRFAESIEEGLMALAPDAGPPRKVFGYLEQLNELAKARSSGSVGESVVTWLQKRGVICSIESETVRKSKGERKKRTWVVGGLPVEFDFHLKPSDNVAPDRCVRIYFDLPDDSNEIRVGYVGRHPE